MSTIASSTYESRIWSAPSAPLKLHSRAREAETTFCAGVTCTKSLERIEIPECIYDSRDGLGLLSKDPIGFAAGDTNLYRYVGNHGTYDTDPSGEIPPLVVAGFAAAYYFFGMQSAANAPAKPEEAGDYGQSRKNLEGIISVSTLPLGGAAYKRAAGYGGNVLTRAIYGGSAGGVTHKLSTDTVSPLFLPNSGITTYGDRPWETAGDYGTSILFWTGGGLIGEGTAGARGSLSRLLNRKSDILNDLDFSMSFDAEVAKILNFEQSQFVGQTINSPSSGIGEPVLFGQKRIDPTFSVDPNFPKTSGRSLADVANDLRLGEMTPDDIPLTAFRDPRTGSLVSMNTRTRGVLAEAGLEPTKIEIIDLNSLSKRQRAKYNRRLGEPTIIDSPLPGYRVPVTPNQGNAEIMQRLDGSLYIIEITR